MPQKTASYRDHFIWFIFYFLFATSIGVFCRDIPNQLELFTSVTDFIHDKKVPASDPYSFATGALDIYEYGWLANDNRWMLAFWPPGFFLTTAAVFEFFGVNSPFILILIVFISILIALLLCVFRSLLKNYTKQEMSALLPLLPFAFPVTRYYLLQPNAIVFGESFAIVFFLLYFCSVSLSVKNNSNLLAALAGISLALSAYFRSHFELIISVLSATFVACIFLFMITRNKIKTPNKDSLIQSFKLLIITLIMCHVAMLPWRLHNYFYYKNFSWVQTDSVYKNASRTDEDLTNNKGFFLVRGGGNLACKLEPSYCGNPSKTGFYRVFLDNYRDWIAKKFYISQDYWFSSLKNIGAPKHPPTLSDIFFNLILLASIILSIFLVFRKSLHGESFTHMWQLYSIFICFFVIFTFVHYEVRYFYTLKIFTTFATVFFSIYYWRLRSS